MTPIQAFNGIIGNLFMVCFFYQFYFYFLGLAKGQVKIPKAKVQHRYGFFIACDRCTCRAETSTSTSPARWTASITADTICSICLFLLSGTGPPGTCTS